MQKIIFILLGISVVAAGAWYVTQNNTSTNTEVAELVSESSESEREKSNEDLQGLGSFISLLTLGSKIECTFESAAEGYASEGAFYTDSERFRIEAISKMPEGGTQISNIINDGSYTYVWGSNNGTEMAIKMPNVKPTEGKADAPYIAHEESDFDFEEQVNYECDRWSVDESLFVPPTDVTFMDMETMMQDAMQGLPEGFELPEGVSLPEGFEMPS